MPKLFRASNAALNGGTFEGQQAVTGGEVMTLQGTVNKTGLLLVIVFLSSAWTWGLAQSETPDAVIPWILGGAIGGFVIALLTIYMKHMAWITAPFYAVLEGLVLGGISSLMEKRFPGIAIQSVGLTFATLAVMLVAYKSGFIRATEKFTRGILIATGGIALVYFVDIGLRFFGMSVPLINESGPWGIVVSLVIVSIAALNLIVDFDFIERGVDGQAAKYMEWYGAFGILVTLVWLYLEILRLMSKVRRR